MSVTILKKRKQNYEALNDAVVSMLNTIQKVKQERGRHELSSAVMTDLAGLPETATQQERMSTAQGAINRVRSEKGSGGILKNILSSFDPRVGTHYGTSPVEELMNRGYVQNMFRSPLDDAYKQSLIDARARNPEREMLAELVQAGSGVKNSRAALYNYTDVEFGNDPATLKQLEGQVDWWRKEQKGITDRIKEYRDSQQIGAAAPTGQETSSTSSIVKQQSRGGTWQGYGSHTPQVAMHDHPPASLAGPTPPAGTSGKFRGAGATGEWTEPQSAVTPGTIRQFVASLPPEKRAEIERVPPELFGALNAKDRNAILNALKAGKGGFILKNDQWLFDEDIQWQ